MKKSLGIVSLIFTVVFMTGCFASLDTLRYWDGPDKGETIQTVPCPPAKIVVTEAPAPIKVNAVIFFDWDSNIIKEDGQKILDHVAKVMKENPDLKLSLTGYASEEGAETYNKGLSRRRVDAVKVTLMQKGIKGSRMTTEAKGETTIFGKVLDLNRRAVVLSVD